MIDALTPADADAAAALSAGFGWPHRAVDWAVFLRLGAGFAWREDARLQGTAMWFPLGAHHASIGLVQVAPGLQGRGIGRQLMHAVMDAALPRSLMLHATQEGAGLYSSLGFEAVGVVQQWQGEWQGEPGPAMPDAEWDHVLSLDARATGFDRSAILRGLQATRIIQTTSGYAMRREFGRGALIGPVVAGDEAAAVALVRSLAMPGFVRLDIPAEATGLAQILAQSGLSSIEDVQVMRTGEWPSPTGLHRFGLASQALG